MSVKKRFIVEAEPCLHKIVTDSDVDSCRYYYESAMTCDGCLGNEWRALLGLAREIPS